MKRVAFLTCSGKPYMEHSEALAVPPLAQLDIAVDAVAWDAKADWDTYNLIIPRSTWDYHTRYPEFLGFLDRLEAMRAPVYNPIPMLRWNMDKTYILSLRQAGVSTVPTVIVSSEKDIASFSPPWDIIVVKPYVGASAYGTLRFHSKDAPWRAHAKKLLRHSSVLIQPFIEDISRGEISFVFFDGTYSHAVQKTPKAGEFRVHAEFGGQEIPTRPSPYIIEQAASILQHLHTPPLYARIDGIVQNNSLMLMELELCEPYLFLESDSNAPARFAAAIARRLA